MIKRLFTFVILAVVFTNVHASDYDKKKTDIQPISNEFYIVTAHIDGSTNSLGDKNHPPEAVPSSKLPKGGGIYIRKSDQGKWRMRVFKFIPSQVITSVNRAIVIHFVGSQGPSHRIKIDGVKEEISLKRGEIKTVKLHPTETGVINFWSLDRQPSMSGQIVVLE